MLELLDELDIVEFGVAHDSEMRSEDWDESTREAGADDGEVVGAVVLLFGGDEEMMGGSVDPKA